MHAISLSWSIVSNDATMAIFLIFWGANRMTLRLVLLASKPHGISPIGPTHAVLLRQEMQMRSYQVVEFGHTLRDTDMLDPKPTGDEVVIAVKAAGVCHSDLHTAASSCR